MREDVKELQERFLDFAVAVIKLVNGLPKSQSGRHVGGQLLRSGTSSAANYEEACAAESRPDFIHKLGISLKELRESRFWLRVIARSDILCNQDCPPLLKECEELCNIVAKSIITARSQKPRPNK